jgi:hypothetical protein
MPYALRSSLAALVAVAVMTGCQTHDRRIYTTHQDKNLHTPDAWAPSTTKAADDATSALQAPTQPIAPPGGGTAAPTLPQVTTQ